MRSVTTRLVRDGAKITASLAGSAESDDADDVHAFLDAVLDNAASASEIVVDLLALEFATSSCLKELATFLLRIGEHPDRWQVIFRSNPRYPWQRRSLSALAACAPGQVEIKVEP